MSKYALSATGKVPGDKIKITCKVCDRLSLCGKDEDPKTMRCGYCGHNFGIEVRFFADDIPNASSETHIRHRWFCSGCEHRGLKWVLKMTSFSACPNCSAPLPSHMSRPINPDKGSCSTIWDSEETEPPIRLSKSPDNTPRTSGVCRSCGHEYSFRVMPPFRCDNCGESGETFRSKSGQPLRNSVAPLPKPERKNKYIDCSACGFHHSMHLSIPKLCSCCGRPFSRVAEVQS